jgi:hypothetical protein
MARPAQVTPRDLTLLFEARGIATVRDFAATLRVNRATISRVLGEMGGSVVPLGATRRTRYALRRSVRLAGDRWTIYRLDASGRAQTWGQLQALHGGWRIEWVGSPPAWAEMVADREGIWEGFPFFLGDMRPQGFLGRAVAQRVAEPMRLAADPRFWGDDDTLVFLQAEGDDLPGDLILGDVPLRRVLARQLALEIEAVPLAARNVRYPELAAQAAAGGWPGSSAGGEQPKFLTTVRRADDSVQAVLVKFSPPMDSPAGRRWADLLAAEALALDLLAEHGLATPGASAFDVGGRRFLEVVRYDRVGAHGRRGTISLEALHAALAEGAAIDWLTATEALARAALVDDAGLAAVRRLGSFGELIGNTDMHFGNLSFWFDDTLPFRPAPAYDMLPMVWAPTPQGEIGERAFAPRAPMPGLLAEWSEVAVWAEVYWQRVAASPDVSAEFAGRARTAGALVTRMRAQFAAS